MNKQFVPEIYCSYFHSNICHVCKVNENLKRCSSCKSIAYCSKEHQKIDWKIHKNFCAALSKANSYCEFMAITNFDDYLTIKKMKYRLICEYLKRQLFNYENQIWMFPRFCEICFSSNVNIECDECKSVFFCSEDHKRLFIEIHQKDCDAFKLNLQILLFPIHNGIKEIDMTVRDIPKHIQTLPHSLSELLELSDKYSRLGKDDLMQRIRKLNCLSPIATILYGLEQSKLVVDRQAIKDELTIHVVGGGMYEIGRLWGHMIELGFHWISNLVKLDFIIIGPELGYNGTKSSFKLCYNCQQKKCQARCTFHTQLYHDIVNNIEKPDAVVAFNSGLNGCETQHFLSNNDNLPEYLWTDSIKYLVQNEKVPLILTDYTLKELTKDVEVVKEHAESELKIITPPCPNPFADAKPLRNFESQIEPFFSINGCVSVVTRI